MTTAENVTRTETLDFVNRLLMFDKTGADCDTAMAVMARHTITAEELNARRADRNRVHYLPVR
jgi:hypothetical protein